MSNSWITYRCDKPDFKVRSSIDGTTHLVSRTALLNSEVFRDMFACCDPQISESEEVLELQEKGGELTALLRLLHGPLVPPAVLPQGGTRFQPTQYDPATVIPLPLLLSLFFRLADKYVLVEPIMAGLRLQLRANAPVHPLEVYGFATLHDMEWEASEASQYVLPLSSYSFEEIKLIPNVIAYHKLVRLQDFRRKALRELLLGEDIFPHDYGECASHREQAVDSWDRQRKALVGRIESATDVAGEMDALTDVFLDCKTCHKACRAAVDMLAYKCRRIPRILDQLPEA
ncbi:hypothetical protein CPB84DRAFT_1786471 [Gymnopilus junonius]|uniref:BTB domain-containing protein n=1 Tax=Gymnopilus junonius TaxID=109634 RepID=A0A9P5NI83_GYMJU|nr:hypothetical protein CPB84DRAFT_1786471 [Gymnopilus junonius]